MGFEPAAPSSPADFRPVATAGPSRLAALVVGGLTLAAGAALAGYAHFSAAPAPPAPVAVSVVVAGPDGEIFNGSADGRNALEALLAAGAAGNFTVEVQSYPNGRYVWSVAGFAASGECGWVYWVNGAFAGVAADRFPLAEGDRIAWQWGCASAFPWS